MLKELRIHNLVLIESAEIHFLEGLNMITGETGSGKSAILSSLNLIAGEKADSALIRNGAEKAIVEAVFDIDRLPEAHAILQEAGIQHNADEYLILKRELSFSGKGRAYVNQQPIQVSILKQLGDVLLEITGQNAPLKLKKLEAQRQVLDLYCALEVPLKDFRDTWDEEQRLRKEWKHFIEETALRHREIDTCKSEIKELESASLKEGEEEELFQEYALLANAQERIDQAQQVINQLSSLATLSKLRQPLSHLAALDPAIEQTVASYQSALVELEEIAYTLRSYLGKIHADPERLYFLDERLGILTKLKRKYGETHNELIAYLAQRKKRLLLLESAEHTLENLEEQINRLAEDNGKKAKILSTLRRQGAQTLAQQLTQVINQLNMLEAKVEIDVLPKERSREGDDLIELFLRPNKGEKRIPLRESASGGELSRVMLGIYTLLAGKGSKCTLLFDEIDANIGGETATLIGEQLREVAKTHQVICVTHFAQVAQCAEHHIKIYKEERNGRTFTDVAILEPQFRSKELDRMLGVRSR